MTHALWAALLEATDEAALVVGPDGRIVAATRAAEGLAGPDLVGRPLEEVAPAAGAPDRVRLPRAPGGPVEVGARTAGAGPAGRVVLLRPDPSGAGEVVATLGHALRTPLTTVLGMTEALQDGVYGAVPPSQAAALRAIEEAGRRLKTIVDGALELVRLEAGPAALDLEPVDVHTLVGTCLREAMPAAQAKRQVVSTTWDAVSPVVEADAQRLAVSALIDNAVKFTGERGRIEVRVAADAAAGLVRLVVADTGPGIPEAARARLFAPLARVDPTLTRGDAGPGLGLTLARRVARLHGGDLALDAPDGGGARFTLTLASCAEATEPAATPLDPTAPAPAGRRILLAEDNDANVATVSAFLEAHGWQVVVARDGAQAVELANRVEPAAVLMDMQMPGVDGMEAIRRLRASPATARLPIVAITAMAMRGDRERCLAAGADEYLPKPLSLRGLLHVLGALLDARGRPGEGPGQGDRILS